MDNFILPGFKRFKVQEVQTFMVKDQPLRTPTVPRLPFSVNRLPLTVYRSQSKPCHQFTINY